RSDSSNSNIHLSCFFFFQAEDGIRDFHVTGVQTCALPISISPTRSPLGTSASAAISSSASGWSCDKSERVTQVASFIDSCACSRSEEHTSELQSRENLVCRLLLEKKKKL